MSMPCAYRVVIGNVDYPRPKSKVEKKYDELKRLLVFKEEEIPILRRHIIHNLEIHTSNIIEFDFMQIYTLLTEGSFLQYPKGKFPPVLFNNASAFSKYYLVEKVLKKLDECEPDKLIMVVAYIQSYYIFS